MIGQSLAVLLGVIVGTLIFERYIAEPSIKLPAAQWQCTDSRVINDTLPRQEECIEYSWKEAP